MKPLKSKRFLIREFNLKDVTSNYLDWFKDPKNNFIVNKFQNIKKLKKYATSQIIDKKYLFFLNL